MVQKCYSNNILRLCPHRTQAKYKCQKRLMENTQCNVYDLPFPLHLNVLFYWHCHVTRTFGGADSIDNMTMDIVNEHKALDVISSVGVKLCWLTPLAHRGLIWPIFACDFFYVPALLMTVVMPSCQSYKWPATNFGLIGNYRGKAQYVFLPLVPWSKLKWPRGTLARSF